MRIERNRGKGERMIGSARMNYAPDVTSHVTGAPSRAQRRTKRTKLIHLDADACTHDVRRTHRILWSKESRSSPPPKDASNLRGVISGLPAFKKEMEYVMKGE
ncbi:hypothetical protein EVAR_5348_1 [Eumeta japonica]|uniref:Uncharacterized protein n=1 Tax=Eumeta variegata TaxID=151549 RepID=A0A4C1TN64_EUMVA|nr:hypothetical protein EVAR_5348_1 [Eumeta japonica]